MKDMELKPCPFCGGQETLEHEENYDAHSFWWIECDDCSCKLGDYEQGLYEDNPGKERLINDWNRRA